MAKETLVIIDYGSGNLRSAAKALQHVAREEGLETEIIVSSKREDIARASRLVLPGQGAFGDCINNLTQSGLVAPLEEAVLENGIPFLGICVGMQLLATRGLEHGRHTGLGWIPGQVVPLAPADQSLKIPHMGWNTVQTTQPHFVLRSAESCDVAPKHYYFVHSYMFECKNNHHMLGITDYGQNVTAIVGRDNIIGVQFHPEKSAGDGLKLLAGFIKWRP